MLEIKLEIVIWILITIDTRMGRFIKGNCLISGNVKILDIDFQSLQYNDRNFDDKNSSK